MGTESWFHDSVKDGEIFPRGYAVYRRDRKCHGGGMFLLIAAELHSTHSQTQDSSLESVWFRIYVKGK